MEKLCLSTSALFSILLCSAAVNCSAVRLELCCHLLCCGSTVSSAGGSSSSSSSRAQCSTLCHGNAPSSPDSSQPPPHLLSQIRSKHHQHFSPIEQKRIHTNTGLHCSSVTFPLPPHFMDVCWHGVKIQIESGQMVAIVEVRHLVKYCHQEPGQKVTNKNGKKNGQKMMAIIQYTGARN